LWKEDGIGEPKLLIGVPNPIPFCSVWGNDELRASEKERFISSKILKYIELWKIGLSKDNSYSKVMGS